MGLGHRRIGFIGDEFANPFGFTSSRDRFAGYERALTDAGLEPAPEDVALGAHGRYEARDLAATMLSRPDRPTAIFAASDTQALGVLAAAQDLGLHVPDDLSVIGYDDIEACDFVGLTTVRQHLFESGRAGRADAHGRDRGTRRATAGGGHPTGDRPTTDDGAPEGGPPPRVTDRKRALPNRRSMEEDSDVQHQP